MERVFIVDTPEGERVATYEGRVIVATTEQEIAAGPTRHTDDPENRKITVTEWIEAHGGEL
jgi:hypothetical protein